MGLEPGVIQDKTKGKWKENHRWLESRWLRPPNAVRTRRGTSFGGSRDSPSGTLGRLKGTFKVFEKISNPGLLCIQYTQIHYSHSHAHTPNFAAGGYVSYKQLYTLLPLVCPHLPSLRLVFIWCGARNRVSRMSHANLHLLEGEIYVPLVLFFPEASLLTGSTQQHSIKMNYQTQGIMEKVVKKKTSTLSDEFRL